MSKVAKVSVLVKFTPTDIEFALHFVELGEQNPQLPLFVTVIDLDEHFNCVFLFVVVDKVAIGVVLGHVLRD